MWWAESESECRAVRDLWPDTSIRISISDAENADGEKHIVRVLILCSSQLNLSLCIDLVANAFALNVAWYF